MMAVEYPSVLGSPVAGTVEAVGSGVTKIGVGQRVVCGCKIFTHKKAKYGGLQRFTIVDESEVLDVCVRLFHGLFFPLTALEQDR